MINRTKGSTTRKQCVAKTLATTYSQSHRCLKTGRMIEKNIHLCAHHSEKPLRDILDQEAFRLVRLRG